jgi:oxalate decarboxylase/phosphoglucose isomerase-like protein (cupin superfamily)
MLKDLALSVDPRAGGRGAGAQPHWHSTAWNWLVHGSKRWVLWSPEHASYAQRHVSLALPNASEGALHCEQRAGEVLIVPEAWGHATINRGCARF